MMLTVHSSEPDVYSPYGLDIQLSAEVENHMINVHIKIKNKEQEISYIPHDFLEFYMESNNRTSMKNNWLRIYDNKNNEVQYFGIMASPVFLLDKPLEKYYLGREQEYIISLRNIETNYFIPKSEWITIQYYGPLGKSNAYKLMLDSK